MDILLVSIPTSIIRSKRSFFFSTNSLSSYSYSSPSLSISCSSQKPQQNGDSKDENDSTRSKNNNNGDKFSTDWNKAWSSFKKQSSSSGKKKKTTQLFSPNKYVTWNPRPSNYPLSEEVDPIKKTEKFNLMIWTSPKFTLFGAILIVAFLLIYTVLAPFK